jgi:FtsP/CotA-like multicopper oxidase with cupredoxin domain
LNLVLGAVEEWTIKNTTLAANPTIPGPPNFNIDHPLHIHINPFQVTEFFDPNEKLTDPSTGKLMGVLVNVTENGRSVTRTKPLPRYIMKGEAKSDPRQCELDPDDKLTWREGGMVRGGPCAVQARSVWWDVMAIPSARPLLSKDGTPVLNKDGTPAIIPGSYTMRSRFVDFPGLYVMHCHILIHEDRGMMFRVEVLSLNSARVPHH